MPARPTSPPARSSRWRRGPCASRSSTPIGTAIGGITGPLYFGKLIDNASAAKDITGIAPGYFLGAALMVAGGIVAIFLGVHAEGETLENIAKPLTAEDADAPEAGHDATPRSRPDGAR